MQTGTDACDASFFEQAVELNGAVNPYGVHYKTQKYPARFTVPSGIRVDVWDCFAWSHQSGPVTLTQVCEATFRRVG